MKKKYHIWRISLVKDDSIKSFRTNIDTDDLEMVRKKLTQTYSGYKINFSYIEQ